MKEIVILPSALKALKTHGIEGINALKKLQRFAQTGAGDVTPLVNRQDKRLRIGKYRLIFMETDDKIIVTEFGKRETIYE
jgi:mRNA interferase RelE/StbE